MAAEGITAILVTHDVEEAIFLGDRIVIMHSHPGRITEIVDVPSEQSHNRSDIAFLRLRDRVMGMLDATQTEEPNRLYDHAAP